MMSTLEMMPMMMYRLSAVPYFLFRWASSLLRLSSPAPMKDSLAPMVQVIMLAISVRMERNTST